MPPSIDKTSAEASEKIRSGSKIFLIGYRGCGKTTVGRILANQLGWPLVDTDAMIVDKAGVEIAEIFRELGEPEFRRLETDAIAIAIADPKPAIVSLGGGAPIQSINRPMIQSAGRTVWLRANAETLWNRIRADEQSEHQRPNLTSQGGLEEVKEILRVRTPIYRDHCDKIIDVDRLSPKSIAAELFNWMGAEAERPTDDQRGTT